MIAKGKSFGTGDDEEGSETYSEEEDESEEDEDESKGDEGGDWDEEWGGIESESEGEGEEGTPEPTSELSKCESALLLPLPVKTDIDQRPEHMFPRTSEKRS